MLRYMVLLGTLLIALAQTSAASCLRYEKLSYSQKEVLSFSYLYGKKYDMGYTLAAIAWHESHAGEVNVNISDPSFGPYHVTIMNALDYYGWRDTAYNRNVLAQMMLDDIELSASFAIRNLQTWKKMHGENWPAIWASYNAGGAGLLNPRGANYSNIIRNKVAELKQCMRVY